MRWAEINTMTCSVARTLSVVGDRWTMLIIRDAFLGVRRFEHFQKDLRITRHRLTDRLHKLVVAGILKRVQYQTRPPRHEYRLSEKGLDLYPIMLSMMRWGDQWMAGGEGVPVEVVHRKCGKPIMPALRCPECRDEISAREMSARPGPALRRQGVKRFGEPRAAADLAKHRET